MVSLSDDRETIMKVTLKERGKARACHTFIGMWQRREIRLGKFGGNVPIENVFTLKLQVLNVSYSKEKKKTRFVESGSGNNNSLGPVWNLGQLGGRKVLLLPRPCRGFRASFFFSATPWPSQELSWAQWLNHVHLSSWVKDSLVIGMSLGLKVRRVDKATKPPPSLNSSWVFVLKTWRDEGILLAFFQSAEYPLPAAWELVPA